MKSYSQFMEDLTRMHKIDVTESIHKVIMGSFLADKTTLKDITAMEEKVDVSEVLRDALLKDESMAAIYDEEPTPEAAGEALSPAGYFYVPDVPFAEGSYSHDDIAFLANDLWKEAGCPSGRDEEFWFQAERLLNGDDEMPSARGKKPVPKPAVRKVAPGKMSCWELSDQVIGNCDRILLWGVSGTGKSWAARRTNLKGEVFSVSLTDDTPAAELRGHYGVVEGSYKWLDGPCVMAWRKGCRLVLNELEKASGDAQTFLLGILDDFEIAQQTLPTGETIKPNKGFQVVATMNGQPETDLNPALRDRFPVCIHIDEVAPAALAKLPKNIQDLASKTGNQVHAQRRASIRVWNEFMKLRKQIGDEMAAQAIFADRARTVIESLRLT